MSSIEGVNTNVHVGNRGDDKGRATGGCWEAGKLGGQGHLEEELGACTGSVAMAKNST